MSLNDFRALECIKKGENDNTKIYRAIRKLDAKPYIIKVTTFDLLQKKEAQAVLNEIRILASMEHVNIVSYKEAFVSIRGNLSKQIGGGRICLVMDYCN